MGKGNSRTTNLCYAGIGLSAVGLLAFLFMPCIVWEMIIRVKFSLISVLTNSSLVASELGRDDRRFITGIALIGMAGFILNGIMFYMGMKNQYQRKKIYYMMIILGAVLGIGADGVLCIVASELYGKAGSGCILSILLMIAGLVVAIILLTQKLEAESGYSRHHSGPVSNSAASGPDPIQKLYEDKVRPAAGQMAAALNQKLNQGRIRGCSGIYNGYDIPMTSGEALVIGRDASRCQMVLQGAKISRLHCQIVWNEANNVYYVTDYSSNGTYYIQGTRLPAGKAVAIRAGQQIYLGDKSAIFRLG